MKLNKNENKIMGLIYLKVKTYYFINMENNSKKLKVHSFAFHPSISELQELQSSNRGIFPTSLYSLVEEEENRLGHQNVLDQPIIFRISGPSLVKDLFCHST